MSSGESIIRSIRGMLVPIRREGYPFIGILVFVALFFGWFWQPILWVGLILATWCAYFFRDPPRVTPIDADIAVSPADGKVVSITVMVAPRELGLGEQSRRRVSVAMNLFDCHVNRAPVGGIVTRIAYTPGKLINAEIDKASEGNERSGTVIEGPHGPVGVMQIAGLVARRIVSFAHEGDDLSAGERIGMIRFGSRVDVYLPFAARVLVAEGQTAIAGETVIARFGEGPGLASPRRARID